MRTGIKALMLVVGALLARQLTAPRRGDISISERTAPPPESMEPAVGETDRLLAEQSLDADLEEPNDARQAKARLETVDRRLEHATSNPALYTEEQLIELMYARRDARVAHEKAVAAETKARRAPSQSRRRANRGRKRTGAAALLLIIGLLLLAEVTITLLWQDPISALSAQRAQEKLSEKLEEAESAALAAPARFAARAGGGGDRAAVLARRYGRRTAPGEPLGRIQIADLDTDFVFVAGARRQDLKKGPGHYSRTALPGERGTVGIAGHRTTYLAPFRDLDDLKRGDEITLTMPYGRFRYAVEGSIVVSPTSTSSLRPVRHDRLALTTCTPPFSAEKRLVVTARLRSTKLRRPRLG